MPYKVVRGDNNTPGWTSTGSSTPLRDLAIVLQKMKKTAEDHLGQEVKRRSSPSAYLAARNVRPPRRLARCRAYRSPYRERTRRRAGLRAGQAAQDSKIAVFDLGGGTFDISILSWAMASSR